jgi:hypothetical protein
MRRAAGIALILMAAIGLTICGIVLFRLPPLLGGVSMWFADIYCDLAWIAERKGLLGPARFTLRGPKSASLGINAEFLFFGDGERIRHFRIAMSTEDRRTAETFMDLNIQAFVTSLEVAVIIETQQPFSVAHAPRSEAFPVAFTQDPCNAAVIELLQPKTGELNYGKIALGMATLAGSINPYVFYLRRFIDHSLPLDVRWLNGYRFLEWHFVGAKANLSRCSEWRKFVARFDDHLLPLLGSNRKSIGLLEEARALAAHAGMDQRPAQKRAFDPRNAMEKTMWVLEQMVITVLNEHPLITAGAIKFQRPSF